MSNPNHMPAVNAQDIHIRNKASGYPEPFFSRMAGRTKRQLGNYFGLQNFGVNLTELAPGGESSIMHKHTKQDEFVYILDGTPTLATELGEEVLRPGMCIGFPANGIGHHIVNRTNEPVRFLEIGDRTPGDEGHYPQDDLLAVMENGGWVFKHKNGQPYA